MYDCLYIHVPFCSSKCSYCAFYSETACTAERIGTYLARVEEELTAARAKLASVRTVYIGGGTPTILSGVQLERLLSAVSRSVDAAALAEYSLECNPESLTALKVEAMAAGGVNRVSLGLQSFIPRLRETLGRAGAAEAGGKAVDLLRSAAIRDLGGDLIYGIPGQSVADWREDLHRAGQLGLSHLSTYALTIEEGTRLARQAMVCPADDAVADMWEIAEEVASDYGLRRYEVSNFACPGHECLHNDLIWHGARYLGLGPAASSFDGRKRWTQANDLSTWLAGAPPDVDELPAEARACEILAFGMRTVGGWSLERFRESAGYDAIDLRAPQIEQLVADGLVELDGKALRPTARGLLFGDTVATALL